MMIRPNLTRAEAFIIPPQLTAQRNVYEYFDFLDYNTQSLIFNIVAILCIVIFVCYLSFLYQNRRKNLTK